MLGVYTPYTANLALAASIHNPLKHRSFIIQWSTINTMQHTAYILLSESLYESRQPSTLSRINSPAVHTSTKGRILPLAGG